MKVSIPLMLLALMFAFMADGRKEHKAVELCITIFHPTEHEGQMSLTGTIDS